MIAVLVLAVAMGASLQAISNYTDFQASLEQRYRTHLIAWNAFMECYVAVRTEEQDECDTSGFVKQKDVYWDWEAEEQEGKLLFNLVNDKEIEMPLRIRKVQVFSADSDERVVSRLASILISEYEGVAGSEEDIEEEDEEDEEEDDEEDEEEDEDEEDDDEDEDEDEDEEDS